MKTNLRFVSAAMIFLLLSVSLLAGDFANENFNWAVAHGKSPAKFTAKDWRPIIDATWGQGLPTATKLQLFDRWWNEVHLQYGAFHNFEFDLPVASRVTLKVFDMNGRAVSELLSDQLKSSGHHEINFAPQGFASGVYFYELKAVPLHSSAAPFAARKTMSFIK